MGYYGWQGQPIGRDEWVELWLRDRHVGLADLGRRGLVSTVWLGHDMGMGWGPPIIFETMIFGGLLDGEQGRYSTLTQARRGHRGWVRLLRSVRGSRPLIHNGRKPRG